MPQEGRPHRDESFERGRDSRPKGRQRPFGPLRRHDRDQRPSLSPEQIRARLSIVEQVDPQIARQIRRVLDEAPQRAGHMWDRLRQAMPHIERLEHLQKHDPVAFELNVTDLRLQRRSRKLAMRIRHAGSAEQTSEEELRQLIAKHFDIRQRKMEHKLETLEEQIQTLRERVDARRSRQAEIEKHRFKELIGADSELIW